MMIPNIWENKKCSKPPTRTWCTCSMCISSKCGHLVSLEQRNARAFCALFPGAGALWFSLKISDKLWLRRWSIPGHGSNSPGTNGNCVGSACSLSTLGSAPWRKYYRSAWMWFATQGKKVRKKHQSKRDVRMSVCLHLLGWTLAFDDLQISKQLARKLDLSSQGTDCDELLGLHWGYPAVIFGWKLRWIPNFVNWIVSFWVWKLSKRQLVPSLYRSQVLLVYSRYDISNISRDIYPSHSLFTTGFYQPSQLGYGDVTAQDSSSGIVPNLQFVCFPRLCLRHGGSTRQMAISMGKWWLTTVWGHPPTSDASVWNWNRARHQPMLNLFSLNITCVFLHSSTRIHWIELFIVASHVLPIWLFQWFPKYQCYFATSAMFRNMINIDE